MATLTPYGKMNLVDQANHDARRRSIKRVAIIGVSAVALIAIVAVIAVGVSRGRGGSDDGDSKNSGGSSSGPASIKAICDNTLYPEKCQDTLSKVANGTGDPAEIYRAAVLIAMSEVSRASTQFHELKGTVDPKYVGAINGCEELLNMSYDSLNQSISSGDITSRQVVEDFKTWLSAAMTFQDTCLEGFNDAPPELQSKVTGILTNSTEFTSNGLAILTQIGRAIGIVGLRRRLLDFSAVDNAEFPPWMSTNDRKLLQAPAPDLRISANIVVAQDGSGKFTTIKAAIEAVPDKSATRTVIWVKKGVYNEHVVVEKSKWNVMMVGDGSSLTTVTGKLNAIDGVQTFKTASLTASGQGFIAIDMGFQNTAGAAKHQAVAMMSNSDKSAFYRCKFDAYQDTLYPHSMRQFYRDSVIIGTVDFIFGNAAVVFQNCKIMPRLPMSGQKDTLTAQGKNDPNQNTGTSFHNCAVTPYGNIGSTQVYLGRPWKPYSTTVFMKTALPAELSPAGWLPWEGDSGPKTIFYGEYGNTGPGSSIVNRVKWAGVRSSLTLSQANMFTVSTLLEGGSWISAARIPFTSTL